MQRPTGGYGFTIPVTGIATALVGSNSRSVLSVAAVGDGAGSTLAGDGNANLIRNHLARSSDSWTVAWALRRCPRGTESNGSSMTASVTSGVISISGTLFASPDAPDIGKSRRAFG